MDAAAALRATKFVVCNADEGEPGTFKDRVLLDEYPISFFRNVVADTQSVRTKVCLSERRVQYLFNKLTAYLDDMRKKKLLVKKFLKRISFDIGSG